MSPEWPRSESSFHLCVPVYNLLQSSAHEMRMLGSITTVQRLQIWLSSYLMLL